MKTQTTFENIHINQCFTIPGMPRIIYKKVATTIQPLWNETTQAKFNTICIKSVRPDAIPVGYHCNMMPGEVVRPCKNPEIARQERNTANRAKNQILRDLCGTSARAAREDMGM